MGTDGNDFDCFQYCLKDLRGYIAVKTSDGNEWERSRSCFNAGLEQIGKDGNDGNDLGMEGTDGKQFRLF